MALSMSGAIKNVRPSREWSIQHGGFQTEVPVSQLVDLIETKFQRLYRFL